MAKKPGTRAQEILQALARMLEKSGGGRITTAALAAELGVSEAALYRHFPSKTRMYEGLIDFIEDTVFRPRAQHYQRRAQPGKSVLPHSQPGTGLCRKEPRHHAHFEWRCTHR